MSYITDFFAMIGENFPVVLAGCMEIVVAVVLLGKALSMKQNRGSRSEEKGLENRYLHELSERRDELILFLRCRDLMPVRVIGDLQQMLGVTEKELREDATLLSRNFASAKTRRAMWKKYREWNGKDPFSMEIQLRSDAWLKLNVTRSEDGEHDLFEFYKITELHEQMEQYEEKLREAEEESSSKTTFLSRMSHEIRTPMNGIIGMLTLAEGKMSPEHPSMQYITRAEELSDHLLSLINDILDMSRIEAGKVELEEQPFSIRELGDKLYNMFAKQLKERKIYFAINYEDMTVDYVVGDELRISQIIINFLSNAVKFTSEGEILVTFRQMMKHENVVDLMICVHDTGIGMEPEFLNRIFRPFEQEGIEISKKYGGTGLGMAITDQLVQLMGGQIIVESEPGKGSDFTVFLPLVQAEETEAVGNLHTGKKEEADTTGAFRGRRILLAEDNEVNAMIAEEILKEMGALVELAENGEEAVQAFASHPEGYYDFILMDVQMPVMDGREAARTIRQLQRPDAGSILIFALSADAFVEDERMSIESGMNGHYAKPINFTELEKNVGRFLQKKGNR